MSEQEKKSSKKIPEEIAAMPSAKEPINYYLNSRLKVWIDAKKIETPIKSVRDLSWYLRKSGPTLRISLLKQSIDLRQISQTALTLQVPIEALFSPLQIDQFMNEWKSTGQLPVIDKERYDRILSERVNTINTLTSQNEDQGKDIKELKEQVAKLEKALKKK